MSVNNKKLVIQDYFLSNAYPNPFNPSTNINFNSKKSGNYQISVYNILGERLYIVNRYLSNGAYSFYISGFGKAGIYFFRIANNEISLVKKLILIDGGTHNNITIAINNNASITLNKLFKPNSDDWKLVFSKDGYNLRDTVISIPHYDLLEDSLIQIPLEGTMHLSGQLTAQPTGAKADGTAVNINGEQINTNNGFFESDVTLSYITNQIDTTQKAFTPEKVDLEFFGDNYYSTNTSINTSLEDKVLNSDIDQKSIGKNATANITVKDASGNPISGSKIKIYKASNDSLMFEGNPGTISLSYSGFEFDDDATFNNIGQVRTEGSANGYVTNASTIDFANPMNTNIVLEQSTKNITVTAQTIDDKFGTVVQTDEAALVDKSNGTVYATDNNSADGISLSGSIPELSDVEVRITNPTNAYSNNSIDISEESQDLGDIIRHQNPTTKVMNLSGNVTLDPTGYTNASDVNVAISGEGSTTTQNGSWSKNVDFNEYVNPVDSNDKINEPSSVTITWSGPDYVTSSSNVSTQAGNVTKNKTLSQTRINATADLEVIVNDGTNPVESADVVVKDASNSNTLNSGSTNSNGIANFNVAYTTFRYASNPISFSNISSLDITASKTDYESNSTNIPFNDPMSTTISITPIGQEYVLDTYFRIYETDGDVASPNDLPNIQFEWKGETITVPNVNGKAHIYAVYTGSNPEANVTILPPSGDYLGTMALTTVNPNKVERLAQSESQASGMDIAVSKLNEAGDEELYVIPGTWTYAGGTLDADGSTVQQMFGRHPVYGTSGHRAVGSYPKTIVFKGTFHEDTEEQLPQSIIDERDAQIDAYLAATKWPHKKLLNYEVKTFTSWSDPVWTATARGTSRNLENMTWAVFGNADRNNIEFSISDPEKYRILNSSSTTTNNSTPANRLSEFFSSMTNTQDPVGYYITNSSSGGVINNSGDNIIGLIYIFKPATRFWQ